MRPPRIIESINVPGVTVRYYLMKEKNLKLLRKILNVRFAQVTKTLLFCGDGYNDKVSLIPGDTYYGIRCYYFIGH